MRNGFQTAVRYCPGVARRIQFGWVLPMLHAAPIEKRDPFPGRVFRVRLRVYGMRETSGSDCGGERNQREPSSARTTLRGTANFKMNTIHGSSAASPTCMTAARAGPPVPSDT